MEVTDAATYKYDELNRLKQVNYEDGSLVKYTYDANGNILKVVPYLVRESQVTDDDHKKWRIQFSKKFDSQSVNPDNIYIVDQNNKIIPTNLSMTNDHKTIMIEPPTEGYKHEVIYTIYITEGIRGNNNELIHHAVKMDFMVK